MLLLDTPIPRFSGYRSTLERNVSQKAFSIVLFETFIISLMCRPFGAEDQLCVIVLPT